MGEVIRLDAVVRGLLPDAANASRCNTETCWPSKNRWTIRCVLSSGPKLQKPWGGEVIGDLLHLRVIPPELMMDAVAQPNPSSRSSSARRDHARNSKSRGSATWRQRNRRRSVVRHRPDVGIPAIVLGSGYTKWVTQ